MNNNNYFDRNYTNNALEVRNGLGNVILQVVHFGDVIHFAGIFHTKKGNVVSILPIDVDAVAGIFHTKKENVASVLPVDVNATILSGSLNEIKDLNLAYAAIEIKPSFKDLQLHIEPIFEYPSELHFGSCPGIHKLKTSMEKAAGTFHFGDSIDLGTRYLQEGGGGIILLL